MSDDTVISPAPAGDMSDAEADAAFAQFAAAKFDATQVPAPEAVIPDPDAEATPAAPAAVEVTPPVIVPTPATPAAAAPAPVATDIWSSATPELRAAHEAELARERQRYNSDLGRQAAHQRTIQDLRDQLAAKSATPAAAPAASPAPTTASLRERPDIKKSLEEYPEVVGPLLDAIEPLVADAANVRRELSHITEDRRAAVITQQEQALTAAHPDWQAACSSKDFADWLATRPAAIKQIAARNGEHIVDAEEAIAMVGDFKAHFALTHPAPPPVVPVTPAAPPTVLSDRRAAQLAAITAPPKGAPTGIPDGPPGGEVKAQFDHFVARKAQRN